MKACDYQEFKKTLAKEVNNLQKDNILSVILLKNKLKDRKLMRFIWIFKHKYLPIGVLLKYKVCFCISSSM